MGRHRHSRKKELLVVRVHLNTGDHDKELQHLKERIQSKVAQGDFYVLLGGDFYTKNRGKAESVLLSIVDAKQPYPVDQNGVDGTNSGRTKPCDWVLCSHDWAKFEISVVMGSHSYPSYPNGHVFDSRVYEQNGELSDVPPVLSSDFASDNMQHMAVVRGFFLRLSESANRRGR